MKQGMNSVNRYLWDVLLYACMGCFSYFFLVHYADIPVRLQDRLMTFHTFLTVIVSFCGVGLSMRYINERLLTYYPYFLRNKRMLSAGLIAEAVILLLSNYLLLVSAKALAGVASPFHLQRSGLTVILLVWLVELVIVGQFILNRFYVDVVRLYKRAEELEESTAEARYRTLQNQLNPHFLFNSLNTLVSEIEYNPVNAIEFTRNLADTYRYILYCQDKHTVELNEELQFLDIQLTDGNSFIFIEQARPQSMIVFTTAYDEYAVRAFTVNSIDYLLKPVHKERLESAIQKFERFSGMGKGELNKLLGIEQLLHSFAERQEKQYRTRFLISGAKRFYTIQVGDIAYFYSLDKVTFAVTKDGKAHVVDLPLSKLEEQLDGRVFFRVNRQFILSADSIRNIQHYFNGKAVVSVWPAYEGTIQISRERMTLLKMWLNS